MFRITETMINCFILATNQLTSRDEKILCFSRKKDSKLRRDQQHTTVRDQVTVTSNSQFIEICTELLRESPRVDIPQSEYRIKLAFNFA